MKKRVLSFILLIAMVFALLPIHASAAVAGFQDVNSGDWFAEAVQYVKSMGIMNGTSSSKFDPNGKTTRGQMVTLLYRMSGSPNTGYNTNFVDVKSSGYYYAAVCWASQNDIVSGKGNRKFAPDDPVTRQDMVTILKRYSAYMGYSTMQSSSLYNFGDNNQVSSYAADAVKWAYASQLVTGTGNSKFSPRSNTTRAQLATILMRYCRNMRNSTFDNTAKRWESFVSGRQYNSTISPNNPSYLEYAIFDITGDHVPELILSEPAYSSPDGWTNNWIFSMASGTPKLLGGWRSDATGQKEYTEKFYGYGSIYYQPKYNTVHLPSMLRGDLMINESSFYMVSGSELQFSYSVGYDKTTAGGGYFYTDSGGSTHITEQQYSSYISSGIHFDWKSV